MMSSIFGSMRRQRAPQREVKCGFDVSSVMKQAREEQEFDLEQKLELELKMREGTAKLLAACKHRLQALEASKSLLASGSRINAYAHELQRRKALRQSSKFAKQTVSPCKGKLSLTELRMPLIWKDSDHFKDRGDSRRFAVFCLVRVAGEVRDTTLLSGVDRGLTDIAFDDVLLFDDVPHDFDLRLEVYSHALQEDMSIASASSKLRKKISHSVSKAIGRTLTDHSLKDDIGFKTGCSDFELVAHANLCLSDADARIKTYDLVCPEGSGQQLPLFGHFCCRMAVQPNCMAHEVYCGHLSLVQQIGNITGSRRMYSSLNNFTLSMWSNAVDMHSSGPDISIPVTTNTKITPNTKSTTYPRFSFKIESATDEEKTELLLGADSPTELNEWLVQIQQHIQDFELWKPASDSKMEIHSPSRSSQTFRNSSLYDETPFSEDAECSSSGSGNSTYNRNRISTPPFCSWSSSSSSTNSSVDLYQSSSKSQCRRPVSVCLPPFLQHS